MKDVVNPKHSAEWFQTALDAAADIILIKGPKSQILWGNKAFLDAYGVNRAELENMIDGAHVDPDDTLQYVIDDQTVFDTGKQLEIPCEKLTTVTGEDACLHTIKSPIFDGGRVVRTIGVSRITNDDLPRRAFDHADAKAYVAPLQTLTSHFPSPMIMLDMQKRVVNTSNLWRQTFGGGTAHSNAFFDELYPDLFALAAKIDDCLDRGGTPEITLAVPTDDGANRMFLMEVSDWRIEGDTAGGAIVIATDVTDLYDKTAALQRVNEDLAQFSYRASHDLKGPLSTAKGLAGFILEDLAAGYLGEVRTNAEKIVATMARLETTVVGVLDLARADMKDEGVEPVHLPGLLSEICGGLSRLLDENAVEVRTDFQVETIATQGPRIRQILENLVANAIKYRAPDSGQSFVSVSTRADGDFLCLSITDNGLGFPRNAELTAFDPFVRFDANFEGSGLGLAIVKRHAEALNGDVRLTRLDDGTRFDVRLPNVLIERKMP